MYPPNHTSNMVPLFIFLEIREEERKILERAGYFQSITVGVAPIVVVIASVVTFSVHMILGYDLTAAQVTYSSVENILYNLTTVAFLLSHFSSSCSFLCGCDCVAISWV